MTNSQRNTNPLIIEANPRRGQVVAAEPTSQDQLADKETNHISYAVKVV